MHTGSGTVAPPYWTYLTALRDDVTAERRAPRTDPERPRAVWRRLSSVQRGQDDNELCSSIYDKYSTGVVRVIARFVFRMLHTKWLLVQHLIHRLRSVRFVSQKTRPRWRRHVGRVRGQA